MSKKRFGSFALASLLVLSGVSLTALTSCGEPTTESKDEVKKITISNKATLQSEWKVGEADRLLEINLEPASLDLNTLISEKKISIISSNDKVISTNGKVLHAEGEGKATITVSFNESIKDSVEITVNKADQGGQDVVTTSAIRKITEDAAKEIPTTNKGEATTSKTYKLTGLIVANDKSSKGANISIFDGVTFINAFKPASGANICVGTMVDIEGTIQNYFGTLQFKGANIVENTKAEKINLPTAKTYGAKEFNDFKTIAISNSETIADPKKVTEPNYIKATVKSFQNGQFVDYKLANEDLGNDKIALNKSNSEITNELKKHPVGTTFDIEGALIGYNTRYSNYNIIVEKVAVKSSGTTDPEPQPQPQPGPDQGQGQGGETPDVPVGESVVITSAKLSLGGSYGSQTDTPVDVGNGIKVYYEYLMDGGNGIQMKNKMKNEERQTSKLWIENTSDKVIVSVAVKASATHEWNQFETSPSILGINFGTEIVTTAKGVPESQQIKTLKASEVGSVKSNIENAKYFCAEHIGEGPKGSGGALYIESITINFAK